ncbi:MAG TPA: hypothetical protein VFD80_03095, partial [Flavobacteriaceae bacterium]|nr:hypothetical protein [Flavobacteriaceae bacterium]
KTLHSTNKKKELEMYCPSKFLTICPQVSPGSAKRFKIIDTTGKAIKKTVAIDNNDHLLLSLFSRKILFFKENI